MKWLCLIFQGTLLLRMSTHCLQHSNIISSTAGPAERTEITGEWRVVGGGKGCQSLRLRQEDGLKVT